MTARTCPVPGCGTPVRAGHAMCRSCWHHVPRARQTAVHEAWRGVRAGLVARDAVEAVARYRRVLAAAVADVVARR